MNFILYNTRNKIPLIEIDKKLATLITMNICVYLHHFNFDLETEMKRICFSILIWLLSLMVNTSCDANDILPKFSTMPKEFKNHFVFTHAENASILWKF